MIHAAGHTIQPHHTVTTRFSWVWTWYDATSSYKLMNLWKDASFKIDCINEKMKIEKHWHMTRGHVCRSSFTSAKRLFSHCNKRSSNVESKILKMFCLILKECNFIEVNITYEVWRLFYCSWVQFPVNNHILNVTMFQD